MNVLRSLARTVAHKNMKKAGLVRVNNHKHGDSFFSEHWRDYVSGANVKIVGKNINQ